MGLGKTIQTIALLALYHARNPEAPPSLIVMPRSLLYNWKREIERFAPRLDCRFWYGADRRPADMEGAQVILTTYALVRNDIEELREREFSYLVLDEAQAIKNHSSRISKAVILLKGRHRLALSGTPIENNLAELYALFRFLNPAMFGSFSRFSREYLAPIRRGEGEFVLRLLAAKTAPFLLRRLKKDVAAELPERSEQFLFVDMEGEQARLYEERRRFYEKVIREKLKVDGVEKSQFFILQGLLELRQLAAVPEAKTGGEVLSGKWEALLDHMEEVLAEGHRCLVFTNFLDSVEIVCRELEERKIPALSMTGGSRGAGEAGGRLSERRDLQGLCDDHEDRGSRTQPDGGRLRLHPRSLVEPQRRTAGHRPDPQDRADQERFLLPDHQPGDHRGEDSGASGEKTGSLCRNHGSGALRRGLPLPSGRRGYRDAAGRSGLGWAKRETKKGQKSRALT